MQTKLNRLGYNCGTADGYAGAKTLSKLDQLSPGSTTEKYGRELTHSQLTGGYSSSSITTEALARCIFGEDTTYSDGQAAVAKEIYNRKNSSRSFDTLTSNTKTWKGIVYSQNQHTVMTGTSTSSTRNSRKPNQYSSEWANCVSLVQTLVKGNKPIRTLANQ